MAYSSKILAQSSRYIIHHEYEVTLLSFRGSNRADIVIGDFYGDPQAAFIAEDESYCVVGGCGLILYYLQEPFSPYQYDTQSKNWKEFNRDAENVYWVESIYAVDEDEAVRFVVDLQNQANRGVYELNLKTLQVRKLL